MLDRLNTVLQADCRLDRERVTLAGVSGGPDSLCLLDLLHRLGYAPFIAHLDHGLRPESAAEAERIRQIAADRGLPCEIEQQDVGRFSEAKGLSLEEGAREARYRFLFRLASRIGAQAVAVGHTADDQVETVLMHLLRGAGLSGLKGMATYSLPNAWSQEIPLVRPLLGTWRQEIWEYLEGRGLTPNLDASNQDLRYFRNRLRHELIPFLEGYNPQIRQGLWRTADILREDYAALQELNEAGWDASLREEGSDYLAFDLTELCRLPVSIQRGVLRKAIYRLRPGLRDIDYAAIQKAMDFIQPGKPGAQRDLIAGLRLARSGERVWLGDWEAELADRHWPQIPAGEMIQLSIPGEGRLGEDWLLNAQIHEALLPVDNDALTNPDPYQAWLDLERLENPLSVRPRRPGDRFQPLGMERHTLKVADFMINVKLPQARRRGWPLVLSGETIAWIPGIRLAHPFRITDQTRRVAHLWLRRGGKD